MRAIVILSLILIGAVGAGEAVPKADFYVAVTGNDSDPGTCAKPFATLTRARDAVRTRIQAGLKKNLLVLVRGGTYYLPNGVTFGPEDSGTKQRSITYAAYPSEVPVLVGGVELKDWTPYKGEIVQANIPEGLTPLQVFADGTRVQIARLPKTGYFKIEGPVAGKEQTEFLYRSGEFDSSGWDLRDAQVYIWPGHDWFTQTKPLVSIDQASRAVTLGNAAGYPMIPGNRYFIKNIPALLTQPGECVLSNTDRKILLWPERQSQSIVASTAESLISIKGQPDKLVRNLHFKGLDLSISNGDAVRIADAQDCSIRFCRIENAQGRGVNVGGHSQRITVYGNLIRENGSTGVWLQGPAVGGPDICKNNLIENNHIHHCGRLEGHGYGIYMYQSGHNRALHNLIHDLPRWGVGMAGLPYQNLKDKVNGVTWENHWDYLHCRRNVIAYNHVYNTCLDSQDGGAFHLWGTGRDNYLDHNIIHDSGNSFFDLEAGIYIDDACDYYTVTNNIVWGIMGTRRSHPILAKGIGHRIENNILVAGPGNDQHGVTTMTMGDERNDQLVFLRNIFWLTNKDVGLHWFINWSDDRIAQSDYNVIWKPEGEVVNEGVPYGDTWEKWTSILGGKFDQHSVLADPLFVDPAKNDYHLKPGSPALKLGFKDIDTSTIGLKADFPERLKE